MLEAEARVLRARRDALDLATARQRAKNDVLEATLCLLKKEGRLSDADVMVLAERAHQPLEVALAAMDELAGHLGAARRHEAP